MSISDILGWTGGLWKNASDWEEARSFVIDVIQDSQGLTQMQRQTLLAAEEDFYNSNYGKSASSGWYEGYIAAYSSDEKKADIAAYAKALYYFVKDMEVPEQVKKVFASLADTTHTIGVTQGDEYKDPNIKIPTWLKVGAAAAIAKVLGLF